jgi:putative inorganic carbon (HCO3(-)) transporter
MLTIFLILIFIRPFISSHAFPYTNMIYSALLLIFLSVWAMIKGVNLKDNKGLIYPLVLFILALFISVIFAQDKIISIKELYKYITGILLFLVSLSLTQKDRDRIILCMIISGLLISLLAIYQYFLGFQHLSHYVDRHNISDPFILDYISQKRAFFPFVTPNVLGGYLAMIILLTLSQRNKISLIIPMLFALLLTKSISALLSIFVALVIYFYLQRKLEKRKLILLFGLLIIIGIVFAIRTITQQQHLQPVFSAVMRLNYWEGAIRIIKMFPVTGVGIGNFDLTYSRYAHNSYLQIWAEMGILGLISFFWLIIIVLKSAFNNIKDSTYRNQIVCLISACYVFLAQNFIDFTFFLPEVALIWWIILGLILSKK